MTIEKLQPSLAELIHVRPLGVIAECSHVCIHIAGGPKHFLKHLFGRGIDESRDYAFVELPFVWQRTKLITNRLPICMRNCAFAWKRLKFDAVFLNTSLNARS
jgi:hypothetical protein